MLTETNCNGDCAECDDTECKAIDIKTYQQVKWTRQAKFAMKRIFDDVRNGTFEDDFKERDWNG